MAAVNGPDDPANRPPEEGDPAIRLLFTILPGARIVGGAVRDRLLGLPVADIDLAVKMTPEQVIEALHAAGIGFAPTGLKHGTVTAIIDRRGFEITSLRRDLATDGRHAAIAYTEDWREDAARRDFTINAMSMDESGLLYDYFGGQDDLAAARIRFVGDAAARVAEDYLRILRFFRFYARFGRGDADRGALAAIRAGVPGLALLSAERVWHELKGLLAVPKPVPALMLMRDTGVLAALLPAGADIQRVRKLGQAEPLLRFAALARNAPAYADRLRMSKAEAALIEGFYTVVPPPVAADDDELRRALESALPAHLIGASRLRGDPASFQARLASLPRPVFPLRGRDALALDLPAGEKVGRALEQVRQWWRAGGCRGTPAECRAELARVLAG